MINVIEFITVISTVIIIITAALLLTIYLISRRILKCIRRKQRNPSRNSRHRP